MQPSASVTVSTRSRKTWKKEKESGGLAEGYMRQQTKEAIAEPHPVIDPYATTEW